MRLGYFTMPLHPPGADPAATLAHDLEQLVELDRLGYDEAWIGEHITSVWENIPAPDLLIAQALAKTERIRLGTGVNCLPNHDPMMLAQRIAQLVSVQPPHAGGARSEGTGWPHWAAVQTSVR